MWRKRLGRLMQLCVMVICGLSMSACKKAPPTDGASPKGGADVATAKPANAPSVANGGGVPTTAKSAAPVAKSEVAPAPAMQKDDAGDGAVGVVPPLPSPKPMDDAKSKKSGVIAAPEPSLGPSTSDPPGDPPLTLKEKIVGKWESKVSQSMAAGNVKNTVTVTMTYEFTLDGKEVITTVMSNSNPALPKPPAIPKMEFSYKVVNDREIEVTTSKFTKRIAVTINGDELNMANTKDKQGKLLVYKKVK